ncbi:MAG: site-specific integrase [Lacipirellulaceae bacterium]
MERPVYKLIGEPRRYRNGHGAEACHYHQRYRLLSDPSGKKHSVSLQTDDLSEARRRAKELVERKIDGEIYRARPMVRTLSGQITTALEEHLQALATKGDSPKHVAQLRTRVRRVIAEAGWKSYAEVDVVSAQRAVAAVRDAKGLSTKTANDYLAALRSWSRWMHQHQRWNSHVLERLEPFKGDTTPTRLRAVLDEEQLQKLLDTTQQQPMRRCLSGPQRAMLYLIASQTGLRASELASLTPGSFDLASATATVTVHCTISKRRTTDKVPLSHELAATLAPWIEGLPPGKRLWGSSRGWQAKAASMLRKDLVAAGLPTAKRLASGETGQIDFHSLRALRVTQLVERVGNRTVVRELARLSSDALLDRYTKIMPAEVRAAVESVPTPQLRLGPGLKVYAEPEADSA